MFYRMHNLSSEIGMCIIDKRIGVWYCENQTEFAVVYPVYQYVIINLEKIVSFCKLSKYFVFYNL